MATTTSNPVILALQRYNAFVRKNAAAVRQLEQIIYIAPSLLPFPDKELMTEAGYSTVGLLSLYHNIVIASARTATPQRRLPRLRELDPSRLILTLLAHTEVIAELIARRWGGVAGAWKLIVRVELLKCALKLYILYKGRAKVLLSGGQYLAPKTATNPSQPMPTAEPMQCVVREATEYSGREGPLQTLGEVLHILRPVVYVLSRSQYPKTSWKPFAFSLLTDALSLLCSSLTSSASGSSKEVTNEMMRRKVILLFYILREPFFTKHTAPAAEKVCQGTKETPLLGSLMRFLVDNSIYYYHNYHFYNSAS